MRTHRCIFANMPTGLLGFLRPLYDIAVWQYILMGGFIRAQQERGNGKLVVTFAMHEVMAGFMCKLLEADAFRLIRQNMESANIGEATGGWKVGDKPTQKLVEWCQDQWRRKQPVFPCDDRRYAIGEPLCVPLFGQAMPLCYRCGTPCPECRTELGCHLPTELLSARAILDDTDPNEAGDIAEDEVVQAEAPPTRRNLRPR